MRLVLDTNVLIAAFATQGACMRLYRHCARRHTLVTAEELISELEEKLLRKLKIAPGDVAEILAVYRSECIVVAPSLPQRPICRDPDDDWVIVTAIAGKCVCIVSGDADLWSLREHDGIRIVHRHRGTTVSTRYDPELARLGQRRGEVLEQLLTGGTLRVHAGNVLDPPDPPLFALADDHVVSRNHTPSWP